MNLPPRFKFNLDLAKLGWPLVARDGYKCRLLAHDINGDQPLAIAHTGADGKEWIAEHSISGAYRYNESESVEDAFLSSDLTNPDVQAAVKRCHEAGMEIWFKRESWAWTKAEEIRTWFYDYLYLPAVLIPEVQTEPQIAPGHNPDKLTSLDKPKVVQWTWGDAGLPLTSIGKYQGKPVRIDAFPNGVLVTSEYCWNSPKLLTYAEAAEEVRVNGKPFAKEGK